MHNIYTLWSNQLHAIKFIDKLFAKADGRQHVNIGRTGEEKS